MSDEELFRREAIDAQRTSWLGTVTLTQPFSFRLFTAIAVLSACALILFLSFASYTKRVTVRGQLLPESGWAKVYPQQGGIVIEKHVKEGQAVRAGQLLYVLSLDRETADNSSIAGIGRLVERRRQSLDGEIAHTRELLAEQLASLESKRRAYRAEIAVIERSIEGQKTRVSLAEDTLERYKGLLAHDYIAGEQVQLREADLIDQRSRLQGLQRERVGLQREIGALGDELERLPIEFEKQIAELQRRVSSADQEFTESELRRRIVVTAPREGIATAANAELGQNAPVDRPLLAIIPRGAKLEAHLFAPSRAVGFVRAGDRVMVRYDAFPYQKFGHHEGRVSQVARVALTSQELSALGLDAQEVANEPLYRITVSLPAQTIKAYGEAQPLQVGMLIEADVMQETRKLYEWVLEPLISITGKL
ncbi:HlyD family secretion protein [Cognatazoarcus halotolerans]|uniref:HlyD family secretion protein n=1 Tax=Cognatazoarcus halotolerans TaxID=2686016 RepID=UPI00135B0D03|nr:HlyD family efflux transporter periplasmic adaptor subunit [Cognatazoarcus halotolerans]MCB1902384.1 HlyD family efflux transporter periplasmic adaptor subunit [Rhodocyclaceae bacterium]MCP5310162.1 HlyD family efflux transporter periplasmic adaptor subunit [Zoogloeaceae bacterium]